MRISDWSSDVCSSDLTPVEQDSATLDLGALTLPQAIPLSLPSQLAQQRPDIRAAEAQLHQASANVGVATANLYPNLTISGSYGAQEIGRASCRERVCQYV